MGRVRRGGYVFVTWSGDHDPRHVHVFRDGELVARWNLDAWRLMSGYADRKLRRLLEELVDEGQL